MVRFGKRQIMIRNRRIDACAETVFIEPAFRRDCPDGAAHAVWRDSAITDLPDNPGLLKRETHDPKIVGRIGGPNKCPETQTAASPKYNPLTPLW